jgi:DNA mismatch repair protein MutS2
MSDDLLDEIVKTREETRHARDAAIASQDRAEELKRELRQRLDDVEVERRDVIAQTRRMAEHELDELRTEVRRLRHSLQAAGQPLEAVKRIEADAFNLKSNIEMPIANVTEVPDFAEEAGPIFRLGETVWVTPLSSEGEIIELGPTDAEVSIGRLRVRAKLDELEKRGKGGGPRKTAKSAATTVVAEPRERKERERTTVRGASPGLELDLRGTRVEDAVNQVDNYIDNAYVAGLPFVRIIHGKGTGALRKAIRDALHEHPLVQRYERGNEKEGGDGVTVVNLASLV